jgi:hypothetical protein
MGTVGLDWQIIAAGNFSSVPGESDVLMRNTNAGDLEVYDVANNRITGASFLGSVGLDWQFAGVAPVHAAGASDLVLRNGGFAPSSPTGSPGDSGDSTSQLVQAMAGFGGAGGAADGMNSAFGTEALQQQQFLTTPQRA